MVLIICSLIRVSVSPLNLIGIFSLLLQQKQHLFLLPIARGQRVSILFIPLALPSGKGNTTFAFPGGKARWKQCRKNLPRETSNCNWF